MASGMEVDAKCKEIFTELQAKHMHSFIIFKLSDNLKKIEVERTGTFDDTFDDFRDHLMNASKVKKEGRYGVIDMDAVDKDEQEQAKSAHKSGKIAFLMWAPDYIPMKQKMILASSKKAFQKQLSGIHKDWQCNDDDELTVEGLRELMGKKI